MYKNVDKHYNMAIINICMCQMGMLWLTSTRPKCLLLQLFINLRGV